MTMRGKAKLGEVPGMQLDGDKGFLDDDEWPTMGEMKLAKSSDAMGSNGWRMLTGEETLAQRK